MCPKTGPPELPTCCNVDGKTATVQSCKCGDKTCQPDQFCTASTNTCTNPVYPVCSNTDGSKILGQVGQCQCGNSECVAGQKCNAAQNSCEYPVCSGTRDGFGDPTNALCECNGSTCIKGEICNGKQRMVANEKVIFFHFLLFFPLFFSSCSLKSKKLTPHQGAFHTRDAVAIVTQWSQKNAFVEDSRINPATGPKLVNIARRRATFQNGQAAVPGNSPL